VKVVPLAIANSRTDPGPIPEHPCLSGEDGLVADGALPPAAVAEAIARYGLEPSSGSPWSH